MGSDVAYVGNLLISGFLLGGLYSLITMGLFLAWSVVGLIYMHLGHLTILAAYIAFFIFELYGINPLFGFFIVCPILFGIGVFLQHTLIKRVVSKDFVTQMVLCFGIAIILEDLMVLLWGRELKNIPLFIGESFKFSGLFVSKTLLIIAAVAFTTIFLLWLLMNKTMFGKSIRAVADNREVSRLLGIDTERLYLKLGGLVGAVVAVVGCLIALYPFSASGHSTWGYVFTSFVVMALGGLGSFKGIIIAGIALGIIQNMSTLIIPSGFSTAMGFILLVVMLLVKPEGLFGEKT